MLHFSPLVVLTDPQRKLCWFLLACVAQHPAEVFRYFSRVPSTKYERPGPWLSDGIHTTPPWPCPPHNSPPVLCDGGINSLWILSTIAWLSCASLSAIWSQLYSSLTCGLGVSCCHEFPPTDFVRHPTATSWFYGDGTVGVGGWSCWRHSNSNARCDNCCWRLFSALVYCTLVRFT